MRKLGNFLRFGLGVSLAALIMLCLAAGSVSAQESLEDQRKAVIQQILDTSAGDADAVKSSIANLFGDLEGDEAVTRAGQLLDAVPSDISDSDWAAVKAALTAKAGQLSSSSASQAILAKIADTEVALQKTVLQAKVVTDESEEASERADKASSPMAPPPQEQVVCVSEPC
jgi:thioredoxin-like negative regulator of GroEL